MKYEIVTASGRQFLQHELVETATDQVIMVFADVLSAQKTKTHLNCGGGFDGWTPSFMLQK